jgi:hypothetical protein
MNCGRDATIKLSQLDTAMVSQLDTAMVQAASSGSAKKGPGNLLLQALPMSWVLLCMSATLLA